jgi:hypothetical protein
MAKYDTVSKTINEITVTLSKEKDQSAGGRLVAFLKWLSENITDPGYGKPEGGRPDQGLPGSPGHPGNRPPGTEHPGNRPPGSERPDQGLPPEGSGGGGGGSGGSGGRPDNTLPGQQPGVDNELPSAIGEHADEIAKAILNKCFTCETAQPKK